MWVDHFCQQIVCYIDFIGTKDHIHLHQLSGISLCEGRKSKTLVAYIEKNTPEIYCETSHLSDRKKNIPWKNVVAFNSDNCSVMKGHRSGVIAKIRSVQPYVIDVGCVCHMANLAVKASLKKSLFNVDELLSDVVNHFKDRLVDKKYLPKMQSGASVNYHIFLIN